MDSILSLLDLKGPQRDAVLHRDAGVLVTAGAGSGKTRTLVGHFLAQLEAGAPLRALVAITFTDKAAREMRNRIRHFIGAWLASGRAGGPQGGAEGRLEWGSAFAELDSARIGTIHSLCAALLRAHPAEAGVDPGFDVLDENASAALCAQAVETALAWTANDAAAASLFTLLKENALRDILTALLDARLDAQQVFDTVCDVGVVWQAALARAVACYADAPAVRAALATLRALRDAGELVRAANEKLAAQIVALLDRWARIETAPTGSSTREWDLRLRELFALRRENLGGGAGKAGAAKDAVKTLREMYDAVLDPWLGGKSTTDAPPAWALDQRAAEALPQLRRAFDAVCRAYEELKAERRALDFDDLEAHTVALLEGDAAVRTRWQSELRAILVDEFQDTNDRQRRIVYALSGLGITPLLRDLRHAAPTGSTTRRPYGIYDTHLFIVGDGKQSIYRFRGGDVTVLRRVQADLAANGGAAFNLDLTFRAHEPLVNQLNALLEPILGAEDDPARPYAIPFAALRAQRRAPRPGIRAPFVEFCLGVGADAEEGRAAAARALAARLHQLRAAQELGWGDVALLFRAATHFAAYETAFERAEVPFITVAGKGFYARPEVRDLLNALAAIADPTDDLAMAGVLRSPALGLSDGALYLLRRGGNGKRSLWAALHANLAELAPEDAARAVRAREILTGATRLAERVSVAAVLKYFLDATDYRALLRHVAVGERPHRNVSKLLADAHASGLVSLREFLEYVQTLSDVEARAGEAPVEARAAVQLMTVHKAKGLEFPLVVLADAAHAPRGARSFWLDPELGAVFSTRTPDARSVMDRLAAQRDADQDEAEERRLLYVAATRAQEKLLVSGHVKRKKDGTPTLDGWLERLGAVVNLDAVEIPETLDAPLEVELTPVGGAVGCTLAASASFKLEPRTCSEPATLNLEPETFDLQPLLAPVSAPASEHADDKLRARQVEPPPRVWRVIPTAQRPRGPAWVVGKLVHEALRRWRFPDRPDFEVFLYPHALAAGLTDPLEIEATIGEARRLLTRLQQHPLFVEMDGAARLHEMPFTFHHAGRVESGVIDVLYRVGNWRLVDFKTDEIRDEEQLSAKLREYAEQVARYAAAVQALLGVLPEARLCFLDARGEVRVIPR